MPAQDNIPGVLVTNKDEEAVAKHRLTVENVRKLFAVERELLKLMKDVLDLDMRAAALARLNDPYRLESSLGVEARVSGCWPGPTRWGRTDRFTRVR
jgi:hypothetical protein